MFNFELQYKHLFFECIFIFSFLVYFSLYYFCIILWDKANNIHMKILLENIMVKRSLSIRQVAIATGLPKSTVADIMSGQKSPRMDTMEQLAKGLKVRISDLYESPYK